jgi:hypothetical protein
MQEIDEAIEEAEGRKASIVDIKQRVQTFTLPPSTAPGTPKGVVARSGAAPGGSGLTRSPQVYDISVRAGPDSSCDVPTDIADVQAQAKPKPTEGSLEAFQASVFEALDALLGETEGMTRRWRDVAAVVEGYRAEKVVRWLGALLRRAQDADAAAQTIKSVRWNRQRSVDLHLTSCPGALGQGPPHCRGRGRQCVIEERSCRSEARPRSARRGGQGNLQRAWASAGWSVHP